MGADGKINRRGAFEQPTDHEERSAIETVPVDEEVIQPGGWKLDEFIKDRRRNDRDVRIMITGRNSGVGLGKTQLAVQLCKKYDDDWNAEDKAAMSAGKVIHIIQNIESGSAWLGDELGKIADSRRTQTKESVKLTQLWELMRFKNLLSVTTVPSMRLVDVRLLELADVRIHIIEQGLAKIYQYDIKDSDPKGKLRPQLKQRYRFHPIDGDPDYEYLCEQKIQDFSGVGGEEYIPEGEVNKKIEQTREKIREELRREWIQAIYNGTTLSQKEIGRLHGAVYEDEITQQAVSNLLG